jgi:hypothetical protein
MVQGIPPRADDPLSDSLPEVQNFSLVLGGPLYQLFRRAHIDDDVEVRLKRRVLVICGIVWLPLLALCAIAGTLVSGVAIPFLVDVETHARFLLAIPLMIFAELLVHRRMRFIVSQFAGRKLVPAAAMDRFRAAIERAMTWRNSIPVEIALLAIVFSLGHYVRAGLFNLQGSTWYATAGADGAALTLPGYWFSWVSNPFLQFLLLRWFYRLVIWARLLWQVARIPLDLIPTHPDRNGGLGFLGQSAYALSPLLAAFSAMVAGQVANRIFHEGASLTDFKLEIVAMVAIGMLVVLGPLTVFAPQILAAKRTGLREYGSFAAEYMREFDRRWLRSGDRDGEALLGTGDIQSLADLGNAFTVIREVRGVPFGRDMLLQLIWATLLPFAPLVFTLFPLEELLDRLIGAVL